MTVIETNTTSGPGGVSPGRAACEAFWAAVGAGPDVQPPTAAWDWAFSQNTTRAWEAAAKAAAGTELEEAVRERDAAEAKLARIAAHCRNRLDAAIVQGPVSDLCREIQAIIISDGEEAGR